MSAIQGTGDNSFYCDTVLKYRFFETEIFKRGTQI